jgi:hypothetical protein
MAKLGKDRLYERACCFVTDQQIWMIGVLINYLLKHVIYFDNQDFLTAFKVDLAQILSETGLWALKNYEQRLVVRGKNEKRKLVRCAYDLI